MKKREIKKVSGGLYACNERREISDGERIAALYTRVSSL